MCDDDFREALELAVGTPMDPDGREEIDRPWLIELANTEMTAEETARFEREAEARVARIEASSIVRVAEAFSIVAYRSFHATSAAALVNADALLREAIEVAMHDAVFIGVKLHRALSGAAERDEADHPIQNDANGSAKVALLSIDRSEAAWRLIAQATGDQVPADLAVILADLRVQVEQECPHARRFIRPGFDEPGR
jgi:hypothetical protein